MRRIAPIVSSIVPLALQPTRGSRSADLVAGDGARRSTNPAHAVRLGQKHAARQDVLGGSRGYDARSDQEQVGARDSEAVLRVRADAEVLGAPAGVAEGQEFE